MFKRQTCLMPECAFHGLRDENKQGRTCCGGHYRDALGEHYNLEGAPLQEQLAEANKLIAQLTDALTEALDWLNIDNTATLRVHPKVNARRLLVAWESKKGNRNG